MVRPTIMLMIRSMDASFVSTVAMYWQSRMLVERARVDHERDARTRLPADEDVLSRREVRHEAELLMDDADAELLRRTRSGDVHVGAVQADPSGVPVVDAGEDLHQ